jgi:SAM-dependent methyltransferase
MSSLKTAIKNLCETPNDSDRLSTYHLVVSNIFRLLCEIETLEKQGLSKEDIIEQLSDARAFISKSPFYERLQNWPRGYPGDFETVEYLLKAKNKAEPNSLAYLLEEYGMVSPAAQQHRNKLAYQCHLIAKYFRTAQLNKQKLRVLSIGCGSCPDIRQAEHYIDSDQCEFVLIDGDQDALDLAALEFSGLDQNGEFICANILRQLKPLAERENFDLILTGGLFDYFGEKVIIKVLSQLYDNCLNSEGMIFFTNISPRNIDRLWIEYLCNWNLIARSEQELRNYCEQVSIEGNQIKISKDQTGLTYFVELFK